MRYLFLLLPFMGFAQEALTLEDCYRLARDHYPTVQKLDLIARSEDYTLANANKAYLPQVSITGQASYQSETIDFSESIGRLPLPISLPKVSKDQYKALMLERKKLIPQWIKAMLFVGGKSENKRSI